MKRLLLRIVCDGLIFAYLGWIAVASPFEWLRIFAIVVFAFSCFTDEVQRASNRYFKRP